MSYILRLLTVLYLILFALPSFALTMDEISTKFRSQKIVHSEFIMTKHIASITKPLVSKGTMLASLQHGIVWAQSVPFAMRFIMQNDKMVQIVNNNKPVVITAKSSPQMFHFNSLLQSLFVADKAVIEKNFAVDFKSEGKSFSIDLKPLISPLDKVFSKIVIHGSDFIDSIRLEDTQGDSTEVKFVNQKSLDSLKGYDELFNY